MRLLTDMYPWQRAAVEKLIGIRVGALYMEMGTGKTRTALEMIQRRLDSGRLDRDLYHIVDGFHRYRIMLDHRDIYDREGGCLPVSVIDKPIDERMASTIRHNRARGAHDVDLMGNIVAELHRIGRSDAWIAKHLGMDQDEILRLKQITGLAELFKDQAFSRAWEPGEDE